MSDLRVELRSGETVLAARDIPASGSYETFVFDLTPDEVARIPWESPLKLSFVLDDGIERIWVDEQFGVLHIIGRDGREHEIRHAELDVPGPKEPTHE